ncbi:MAG: glycosyltransferase family 4 protein [Actinomycetota bacterium]
MKRIAVNLLWCRPGRVGGSEQYLVRQLAGLNEVAGKEIELQLFAPRGFAQAHPHLARAAHMHESSSSQAVRPLRVMREATWLAARARHADVVHHGGGTIPPRSPQPTLLTIHDLQYLVYPEYFSRTKLRYLSSRLPVSVRRTTHIAVPSEYVRRTVIERLAVPSENVSVVRHGVEPTIGGGRTSEAELRSRYGLTAARILTYPAVTHPHKNHDFLCDLLAGPLRNQDVQLVCAGTAGRAHETLLRRIASNRLEDRVKFVGRLSDADRDGLLAMSAALVFPSAYEGFGAPVIEAMALGTPVITSDAAALPEVVGNAGQVVTLDLSAWVHAIDNAVANRNDWVRRGRERANEFRLIDSGRDLDAAYRHILQGSAA